MADLAIGAPAPEFTLADADGGAWSLSSFRGQPVVLLFYPGDDTPVCTKQLCSVRNNWSRYRAYNAEVVGINTDDEDAHRKFASGHKLPMKLLVDRDGQVVRSYGMKGLIGVKRGVVLIDSSGTVRYYKTVFPVFRPDEEEVFAVLEQLNHQVQ